MQETKAQKVSAYIPNYKQYWNFCSKKGYSGTAIFTKHKPLSVSYDIGIEDLDIEGRITTLEYNTCFLINVYVPNTKSGIARINYRMYWDELFYNYVSNLNNIKPCILCGNFNTYISDLDSNFPIKSKTEFIADEKTEFENLLSSRFIDSYRYLYPDKQNAFTWRDVGKDSKSNNIGCRLDYFLFSGFLENKISEPMHTPKLIFRLLSNKFK